MKKRITYGIIGVSLVCIGMLARPDTITVFAEPDHHISVQGYIEISAEEENTTVSSVPGSVSEGTPNGNSAPTQSTKPTKPAKSTKPNRRNQPSSRIPFGGKPKTGDRMWFVSYLMLMAGSALLLLVLNTMKYHKRNNN